MDDERGTFQTPNGGTKIGQVLEQARKEKGLTFDEVEHATKIRKRYLVGLERDDYGALPDAVYARGFLKTYANYLGLDGEELSRELKDRRRPRRERSITYGAPVQSEFEQPLINPSELSISRKRRRSISRATTLTFAVALLALVALVGALYYVGRGVQISGDGLAPSRPSGEQAAGKPAAGGGAREEKANAPAGREEAARGGSDSAGKDDAAAQPDFLKVEVSVEGAPSWLSILADGNLKYEQIAQPGFSQTFEARRQISIRTGNAGAVGVVVNGQNLGKLGESGEVLTRDFTLKSAT